MTVCHEACVFIVQSAHMSFLELGAGAANRAQGVGASTEEDAREEAKEAKQKCQAR